MPESSLVVETRRNLWNTFKGSSKSSEEEGFEKACERCLMYLYTVKTPDKTEERLLEDLRDILFEAVNSNQVSSYILCDEEKERMRLYISITKKTISTNVKLKRDYYMNTVVV
jgi:hypothetical protein